MYNVTRSLSAYVESVPRFGEDTVSQAFSDSSRFYKGASIYDVRKSLGFFDPPPLLSEFYVLFVRTIGVFSPPPLPPQC